MKTLYLDVCTYCRPFDEQQSLRIRLETDAVYLILKHIEQSNYCAVLSPVHFEEINAIREIEERLKLNTLLERLKTPFEFNNQLARERAEILYTLGFGVADAAHIAFAEQIANIFITCDDRLLKRCQRPTLGISAMNPVEFVIQEDLK
jgi:predicted nucleic acid-binding protein